ncbi:MAG: hypothetical protein KUG75_06950 [Pseudomonadales bacterium]|nr:hypothetical protein [Pseudomonadales bacterium]
MYRLLLIVTCFWMVVPLQAEIFEPVISRVIMQKSTISMQQATAIVRRATGGRIVSASPTKDGGFKVRVVLDGGRVKTYKVDRNGNMK